MDVSSDVYVNPSGSDANSGLSPADPLKTLSFALLKVKSDSLHRNTIHLANGVYSPSNGNKFPLGFKSYVPIVGEDAVNTMIDLDSSLVFGLGNWGEKEIILKNFTVKNGMGDSLCADTYFILIRNCRYVLLDGVNFQNCSSKELWSPSEILAITGCDSIFIKNSSFEKNHVETVIQIGGEYQNDIPIYAEISSCRFSKNYPPNDSDQFNMNTGLNIMMGSPDNDLTARIINCEFTGNKPGKNEPGNEDSTATVGMMISGSVIACVINSTIGDHYDFAGISVAYGSKVYLYNCIVNRNRSDQIHVFSGYEKDTTRLYVYNSQVQDGENGISNDSPENAFVYYDSTNLDGIPAWVNTGDFPYALSGDSPCINTGTQNLPEGILLPDQDLAGNPRISAGEIDMGAYEFTYAGLNEDVSKGAKGLICASPNPFKNQLNIILPNSLTGKHAELTLYDLTGYLITTIFNGELNETTIIWTPGNDHSQMRPGVYLLKFKTGSSIIETIKVIKI